MRTTQQVSITLPVEMMEAIRAKVRSGEYASESEVFRDGIRTLLKRDAAVEKWLNKEVVAAYDALKTDPSKAVTGETLRAKLSALSDATKKTNSPQKLRNKKNTMGIQ